MVSNRYAARYRCDFCGKIADILPRDDDEVYPPPVPEGWVIRYGGGHDALMVMVRDFEGTELADFCDDCVGLPLGTLLNMARPKLAPREPAR